MNDLALQKKEMPMVNFQDYAMTADMVLAQVALIHKVMEATMKDGEHFGVIPGCGTKPSLLKPGAEKISTTFRLAPSYGIKRADLPNAHREYEIICTLKHIPTGQEVGQGVGSCSTMESKYRYRNTDKVCPECGETAIIKGKKEYGGGWLCFKKKGGCGEKWEDGSPEIEDQADGKIEHDNPADYYNTVLKMGKKRAHVDAVLTATAASDIFTQDIEDMDKKDAATPKGKAPPKETKPNGDGKFVPLTGAQGKKIRALIANKEAFSSTDKDNFYKWVKSDKAETFDVAGKLVITKTSASTIIDTMDTLFDEYTEKGEQKEVLPGGQPEDWEKAAPLDEDAPPG